MTTIYLLYLRLCIVTIALNLFKQLKNDAISRCLVTVKIDTMSRELFYIETFRGFANNTKGIKNLICV